MPEYDDLHARAYRALMCGEPADKVAAVASLCNDRAAGLLPVPVTSTCPVLAVEDAGRPVRPELIPHTAVPRRKPGSPEGHAALLHAIAHIEFNAINLALDCVYRFRGLPDDYYDGWLQVAQEEAYHFGLVSGRLAELGYGYGDFPAHRGLWDMAVKTAADPLARMALVPRVLEARGLDATPLIQHKLRSVGTSDALAAVAILDIILAEEVGHVAIGNHWYGWLCARQGLDPVAHYAELVARHEAPRPKPPLNAAARRAAGFTEAELLWLQQG